MCVQEIKAARIADIVNSSENISAYNYDDQNGEFCFITFQFPSSMKPVLFVSLIERIAKNVLLRATMGIKQCRLAKKNEVY